MKNTTAKTSIQLNASPPLRATEAMVSTPTIVQMRKNKMSNRPKWRRSLRLSATAASVMGTPAAIVMGPPLREVPGRPAAHLGAVSLPNWCNREISA